MHSFFNTMFSKVISAALLTALAGRGMFPASLPRPRSPSLALAFNVTIGTAVFQADEILDFTFTPVIQSVRLLQNPLHHPNLTSFAVPNPVRLRAVLNRYLR